MRWAVVPLAVILGAALAPGALAKARPAVPPADRAGIDRTLDVFVPAAIGRHDSVRAWSLATPEMRLGTDKGEWRKGFLPVTPFPVIGTSFHGWTVDSITKTRAEIVLLVHLRKGSPLGAVAFNMGMRKVGGRWLVDSAVPAATFAAAGSDSQILAQPDFAPGGGSPYSRTPFAKSGRIGEKWILIIPAILIGLVILTPVAVIGTHRVRDRRVRRSRAEEDRRRVFRNLPDRPN